MEMGRQISGGCIDLPRKKRKMTVSRINCMKSETQINKSSTGKGPGAGRSHVTAGSECRKGCRGSGVTRRMGRWKDIPNLRLQTKEWND